MKDTSGEYGKHKAVAAVALPDWFQLSSYEQARHFTATEWHINVGMRLNLLAHFLYEPGHWGFDEDGLEARNNEAVLIALDLLRVSPLIGECPPADLSVLMRLVDNPVEFAEKGLLPQVRPLTLFDVESILMRLNSPENRKLILEKIRWTYSDDDGGENDDDDGDDEEDEAFAHLEQIAEKLGDYIYRPIHEVTYKNLLSMHPIVLNLNAPDELILDGVREYLSQTRKTFRKMKGVERNRTSDYAKWAQYGVLPLLDLRIWEKETGRILPRKVVAKAIFPVHSNYDVDTLDKITNPLVEGFREEHPLAFGPVTNSVGIGKLSALLMTAVVEQIEKSRIKTNAISLED